MRRGTQSDEAVHLIRLLRRRHMYLLTREGDPGVHPRRFGETLFRAPLEQRGLWDFTVLRHTKPKDVLKAQAISDWGGDAVWPRPSAAKAGAAAAQGESPAGTPRAAAPGNLPGSPPVRSPPRKSGRIDPAQSQRPRRLALRDLSAEERQQAKDEERKQLEQEEKELSLVRKRGGAEVGGEQV